MNNTETDCNRQKLSKDSDTTQQRETVKPRLAPPTTKDPPIRFHTLHDILGPSLDDPQVREAQKKIRAYSPVEKTLRARKENGYWPPDETCYRPKWTSTVWHLMLLGEMGLPPDEKTKKAW